MLKRPAVSCGSISFLALTMLPMCPKYSHAHLRLMHDSYMLVLDSIKRHLDVASGRVSLLSPYLHYTRKEIDSDLQSVR